MADQQPTLSAHPTQSSLHLYISRLRGPDGTWTVDPEPRTLRETRKLEKFNRCMFGMVTQIWKEAEARKVFPGSFSE